jgi:hypothetical protein
MNPLVDALAHNTHLRTLHCGYNDLDNAYVRVRLAPAVRANTSLRELQSFHYIDGENFTSQSDKNNHPKVRLDYYVSARWRVAAVDSEDSESSES